jgi:hypothetical protein
MVAGKTYIEFLYSMSDLFTIIKNRCSIYVAALVAEGKIKDPDRFLISDDEMSFFYASGESAMFNSYNTLSQLSREITNIIPTTVFDKSEGTITIRVGYKSTIDNSVISSWEIAIRDVINSYILKDWYQQFGFASVDDYPAKFKTLYDISMTRFKSDLNWLDPDSLETARINLETAFREYIDENFVLKA